MRPFRILAVLALTAGAGWVLDRGLEYLLLHEIEIRRTAPGLEVETGDRDRPGSVPFQRQSPTRLWENIPNFVAPGTDPPQKMINSLGCRGPDLREPKSAPRVLCLGDSSTFGLGVGQEESFCAQLEAELRERHGVAVESVNGGVVGYTVLQGLVQFGELAAAVQPDVVILAYGYNERWHHRSGDAIALAAKRGSVLQSVLRHSEAYLLLRHFLLRLRPLPEAAGTARVPRVPPEAFEAALAELSRQIAAAGGRPAFVVLKEVPWLTNDIRRAAALLDAGQASEAIALLQPVVTSKLHRYPYVDDLCARAVAALGREGVSAEIFGRSGLAGRRNWGRAFTEEQYVAAVARVAESVGAAAVIFPPEDFAGLYKDHIHPNPAGHRWIAAQLADQLAEPGWLDLRPR